MKRFWSLSLLFSLLAVVLFSCNTEKNLKQLVYLNDLADSTYQRVQNIEHFIRVGDRLLIKVGALDPASVAPYNFPVDAGYLVEANGSISLPQLGQLEVEGWTKKQLTDTLTRVLSKYVLNPIVFVQVLNFKVTMLGDVMSPGTKVMPEGKGTLLDAIGLAGDLTITGRRDNILVIRESHGRREFGRVDLTSANFFKSAYYILQQNDVIYVEPTKNKVAAVSDQTFIRNLTLAATIISVLTTVVYLVISLNR